MAEKKEHQLTLTFKGMGSNAGSIFYTLMDEKSAKDNFPPKKGNEEGKVKDGELKLKDAKSVSSEGGTTYEISTTVAIPPCTIALIGFHSAKGIDEMEMYKLGPIQVPKDGIFAPEGHKMKGPPKWKEFAFEVNKDMTKELHCSYIFGAQEIKLITVDTTGQKKDDKLGIQPKAMSDKKGLVVKDVLKQGIIPAWNKKHKGDKFAMIKKEDMLVGINGESCQNWGTQQTINEVVKLLKAQSLTTLEFGRITTKKKEASTTTTTTTTTTTMS